MIADCGRRGKGVNFGYGEISEEGERIGAVNREILSTGLVHHFKYSV